MSEAKNTALGGLGRFRYCNATQAAPPPQKKKLNPSALMIAVLLTLAALVLFTAWDSAESARSE